MPDLDVLLADDDGRIVTDDRGASVVAYIVPLAPPAPPTYLAADFREAALALLPTGPIWPRDGDSVLFSVMSGLAPTYERLSARATDVLQDAPAGSLNEMLPEWEATLGLPDPCAGDAPTISQRQRQVVARIGARGGQSVPYFTAFAAALGYQITVQEFGPCTYGRACYGDNYADDGWAHVWQVTAQNSSIEFAIYGETYYGERYSDWGSSVLECELNRVKPSHTILLFGYAPGVETAALWDSGLWDRDTWSP